MTAILRLLLNEQSQEKQNIAINQLAESYDIRGSIREGLTANRTYYVRTNGSDANNGLANTAGGAFLTPQHALDKALSVDLNGFNVDIQLGDGTYSSSTGLQMNRPQVGAGTITLKGNNATPSNVVLAATGGVVEGASSIVAVRHGASLVIQDLKINGSSASYGFFAGFGGSITFKSGIVCGTTGLTHYGAAIGGSMFITQNYSIVGGSSNHFFILSEGVIYMQSDPPGSPITVTVTGTPAFGIFANLFWIANLVCSGVLFSGAATGTRYMVASNSVAVVGGNPAFFPGNAAGSSPTGGQYL